ncbi:RecQ-mediated genome instability protein 1-like protein [Drosera capensis]
MPRRRLQVACSSSSSDEERDHHHENEQQQQPQQEGEMMVVDDDDEVEQQPVLESRESIPDISGVTLESTSSPQFSDAAEMLLSDDAAAEDFVDVPDNLSPQTRSPTTDASLDLDMDCPVGGYLRGSGLSLRRDWLSSCLRVFEGAVPGFIEFDVATKGRMCFGEFLFADMNLIGAGVLPDNVDSLHLVDLPGPFVLQVDEVVNIGSSLRQRYQDVPAGIKRCLKLSMTDGVQRVFGMEYRPIKDLEVLAPAGFKVVLRDVSIRRGLLMLVPETLDILGGYVEELEAARQRLVHEVNKPPRGKRSRTGVMPSLTSRATAAAWQPHDVSNLMATNNSTSRPQDEVNAFANNSTIQSSGSSYEVDRGPVAVRDDGLRTIEESSAPTLGEIAVSHFDSSAIDVVEDDLMVNEAELPFFLLGDNELPFTYLASLSAKWALLKEHEPCVKGKIKCFLTGVKGFQYKQRTTFELRVVQKGIGYSPEEVTAALTSSDTIRVGNMKETLKQFQIFLVNFEGTMLIEMNKASAMPVAFEMSQGCPVSDAWLLVQSWSSFTSVSISSKHTASAAEYMEF